MTFSRQTLLLLAQLAPRIRRHTLRTIDVQYMGMSARYADHVIGLALRSGDSELRTLGRMLRQDFFGPTGIFPGGRMLWSALADGAGTDNGPETLDFILPPPRATAATPEPSAARVAVG
ncbi:MAG: hypothetical protein JNM90_12385 [Burkholderiales bacterium]|nr:hypothetical protein [Burkholderiales bacterium]